MISPDFHFCHELLLCPATDAGVSAGYGRHRIVVAASGGGSNFQALLNAQKSGGLQATFAGLIVSTPNAGAVRRAQKAGIPYVVLSPEDKSDPDRLQLRLLKTLETWKCDVLVLAGFLLKIPESVIARYRDRILNIHPSLLPKFGGKGYYGIRVHRAVLAAGETQSGCSVHLVNEAFDEGPVLAQKTVPVRPGDTAEELAARVLTEEHRLYPAVLNRYIQQLPPLYDFPHSPSQP
ncbi:MAG: phosphoribosylglycinamide formyltransferase [Cyclonatronaceae bacterium]